MRRVCEAIVKRFCDYYGETPDIEYISPEDDLTLPAFEEKFSTQRSWNWNFGKTPVFTHTLEERFNWGGVELHFDVKHAIIGEAQLFTDSLDPAPLESLVAMLEGIPYCAEHIAACISDVIQSFPNNASELEELRGWIVGVVA